jgi:hypothetical protein
LTPLADIPQRLWHAAHQPRDIAGLVSFRVLFGLLVAAASARFLYYGWVDLFFTVPDHHITYWGFSWIVEPSREVLIGLFTAMTALGLMIAAGLLYRLAALAFFLIFTYVELIDVTYYLNHYYLVSLLSLLLVFLPLNRAGSLDAQIWPAIRTSTLPAWVTWLLRGQIGLVYFNAGLAKAGSDWLLHAQPLQIWMCSRTETPLIGPLLARWEIALAMSWAGFLFDTTIVAFLLWPRTRRAAYIVALGFHAMTGVFFNIGMFPVIMVVCATIFFDASWPRHARPLAGAWRDGGAWRGPAWAPAAVALWLTVQALVPLRAHLYGGDVLWHEQGMRWSWRVMVREKQGSVTYRVRWQGRERELLVSPSRYLTSYQERELSAQPDMILRLAHHIGQEYTAQGKRGVEVRADALASLNGRPAAQLIDPAVDLMQIQDGITPATWLLPAPTSAPPRLTCYR